MNTLVMEDAIVRWWRRRRPWGWTAADHIAQPHVNTVGDTEHRLADIAAEIEGSRHTQEGESE